jgi:ABC-type sugar transport system ATPase subunit
MARIELRNIQKFFGAVQVIKDVNLTIEDNEFVVMLGQSGCGKTTTLRAIAGLETIDEGDDQHRRRAGAGPAAADRDIAFVFQSFSLYPHMTVYENIAFPLRAVRDEPVGASTCGARGRQGAGRSSGSCTASRRRCRAATCSAWRSGGRWCGGPRRC